MNFFLLTIDQYHFYRSFKKILEKIFNTRLDAFIEKHEILDNSQYGFRSNMSTLLALLELPERNYISLRCKKIYNRCIY